MSYSILSSLLRPAPLFSIAAILRLVLLLYGTWQDAHSAVKYTDIDYLVFTDAARYVSNGLSPYSRETYRYTPLLAWMLVPTAKPHLFSFGKVVFALADLLAGWLIVRVLRKQRGMSAERAGAFAAIWLWNPMVATISTRGSSEGLLGVLTMALLWAVEGKRIGVAGFILGLSVHFKIYPFIYAPAIIWWMDDEHLSKGISKSPASFADAVIKFLSPQRIQLTLISLSTFMGLNVLMYYMCVSSNCLPSSLKPSHHHSSPANQPCYSYGTPYLTHSYLHHVTRIDHRHNFSPYNIFLYLASADPSSSSLHAFLPQLILSCLFIPFVIAKKDLATSMMAQTFAFVTFNKVCTSQVSWEQDSHFVS